MMLGIKLFLLPYFIFILRATTFAIAKLDEL